MAAPLRYALILLCWGMMLVIYLPLLPAAGILLAPALSLTHWQSLLSDPQLPQAVAATLVSTLIAVGGALLLLLAQIAAQTAHLSADLRLVPAAHSWMYTRGTRADGEQSTS